MILSLATWDLASLVSKLLWYAAVICVAGGSFSFWLVADSSRRFLVRNLRYILIGSIVGFNAVLVYFLVQVGAVVDNGLAGMLDWNIIAIYLDTSIGEASLLRISAFLLLFIGQLIALTYQHRRFRPPTRNFFNLLLRFNAACLFVLCLSFQTAGHIATLTLLPRIAIVLHVLAVSLWIGSLYPLRKVTQEYNLEQVQFIMRKFGFWASGIVGVLLVAALVMATRLLAAPAELINSPYGISLLIKIVLVAGLMALAALNRWRLVPNLQKPGYINKLRNSISCEFALACVILVVAAVLSTVIGPPDHS